jgi:hypothetical protein
MSDNIENILKSLAKGVQAMDAVHTYDELPLTFGSVSQQQEMLELIGKYKGSKKDPNYIYDDLLAYFCDGQPGNILNGVDAKNEIEGIGTYLPAAPVDITSAFYLSPLVVKGIERTYNALKPASSNIDDDLKKGTQELERALLTDEMLTKYFKGHVSDEKLYEIKGRYLPSWYPEKKKDNVNKVDKVEKPSISLEMAMIDYLTKRGVAQDKIISYMTKNRKGNGTSRNGSVNVTQTVNGGGARINSDDHTYRDNDCSTKYTTGNGKSKCSILLPKEEPPKPISDVNRMMYDMASPQTTKESKKTSRKTSNCKKK